MKRTSDHELTCGPRCSLPTIFKTTLNSIPVDVPYLFADAAFIAFWGNKLKDIRGFGIGINWRGRAGHGLFQQRDIPLELFVSLAETPGVRLISLQKGDGREDLGRTVGWAVPTRNCGVTPPAHGGNGGHSPPYDCRFGR